MTPRLHREMPNEPVPVQTRSIVIESHDYLKAIRTLLISELAVSFGNLFGKWPLLLILKFAKSYQEQASRHGKWAPIHP